MVGVFLTKIQITYALHALVIFEIRKDFQELCPVMELIASFNGVTLFSLCILEYTILQSFFPVK